MGLFLWILYLLTGIYITVLIARAVLDWISVLSRDFRPRGFVLIIANLLYTLTDPPLRALRRVIPPLRLGAVALDMGFIVLLLILGLAQTVFLRLALLSW